MSNIEIKVPSLRGGRQPDEAILFAVWEIASPYRARNDELCLECWALPFSAIPSEISVLVYGNNLWVWLWGERPA